MPGPQPQPTALKKLRGNPGKRRINRDPEFSDDTKPLCPSWLNKDAKAEWRSVCNKLYRAGILRNVDKAVLAAYCQSFARWKEAEQRVAKSTQIVKSAAGNPFLNPYLVAAQMALKEMLNCAAQLGMTPAARSRITSNPPSKEKSLADILFAGMNGKGKDESESE